VAITAEILSPDGAPFVGSAGYRMPVDGGLKDLTVTWIRGNLHERFTMDELLRQVPTSRRNLTRRFKMETGEPIQTFIQRLRMDRAKLLLETSSLPIEQVVEQVGYRDTSAFARQFKRHTQLTPNSYRQRYRLRPTAT
jgi:AraC-like DNA-binding protein